MYLKIADKSDIKHIVDMAYSFHEISPYSHTKLNPNKMRKILNEKTGTDEFVTILLKDEDQYVGMLIAMKTELLFSSCSITSEIAWWVEEKYRGTRWSLELISAYEYWSKNVAKADMCQMVSLTTLNPEALDKVYKRRGYSHIESAYIKEWK